MAWTAPATWSTSEVVVASKMNTHIRDNLNYLKGNAGTVTIGDVVAPVGVAALRNDGSYHFTIERTTAPARKYGFAISGGSAAFFLDDITRGATVLGADTSGNVGIGTNAPLARFHVTGAGAVSGAGMAISSVAAVTSIQTIFAAGTVARGGMFLIVDRNNTGAGINSVTNINALAVLGGNFTYTNNDTMTVSVTAGGAVTVARTTGTNGTHDIVILAIFL